MSYYRGDGGNYYRGDYYKGDPFLGALAAGVIGKGVRKAAGWVGSRIGRVAGSRGTQVVMDQLPGVGVGIGIGRGFGQGSNLPALPPQMPGGPIIRIPGMQGGKKVARYTKDGKLIRTMNPLNPKALRRALRRAESFEMFAKKTVNALYKTVDGRRVRTYKKKAG